eukprot:2380544-Amphidinium_carterae.1
MPPKLQNLLKGSSARPRQVAFCCKRGSQNETLQGWAGSPLNAGSVLHDVTLQCRSSATMLS